MTRFLAERGVESKFVNGLRVTTPEVVDAVLKVFAGSVNHELVASLVDAGSMAVGLTGIDARLTEAEPMDPALGAVGKVVRSSAAVLNTLTRDGFVPVVACVAGGSGGQIFNVNADQMAVACASAFRAQTLLFLTDVEGVKDATGAVNARVTKSEARGLIEDGVATGGMQAKLEASVHALENQVGEVLIAPGARPGVVGEILSGSAIGTRIIP